ncbi:MAG: hypothetical protein ACI8UO_001621 [Verrucomicrobiales bacterium]|jgi:hypothetical protein
MKWLLPIFTASWLAFSVQIVSAEPTPEQLEFFEKEIRPIFVEHCYKCHATDSEKIKGGLVLDSKWGWETGGDTGPAVELGNLDESLIIDAVRRTEEIIDPMPPKTKLSDAQVAALEKWVEMGAPDPRPKVEKTGGALVEAFDLKKRFDEHWSWRPVANPEPPSVKNGDWAKSPIDQFVLAKIEAAGLQPAKPADKRTWLRRVYFDLIGLPPTRDQIAAFLADNSPSANEKVVQQLLASPHFGEKWARHWMDLVRYSETCGHEFDYPIPHAHQYRDYLIRAYNADVPYDQFIREHIAGDLLAEPRRHQGEDFNESVIGTGFWYFHDATHAPTDVLGDEADHLDSQIDVMGKAFQGLTIACARCHDHKFDAISTADYYALTGFIQGSCRTEVPIDPGRQIELAAAHQNELRVDAAKLLKQTNGDSVQPGRYLTAAVELMKAEAGKPNEADPWAGEVFDDFEGGYDRWKVEGKAFGDKPIAAHSAQRIGGVRGKKFANSFAGSDGPQGKLTSDLFTIEEPFINFLIGGGKQKETRIELVVDGKPVRTISGKNSDKLEPASWSVADLVGKAAELRIIDEHRGGWGHIDVDHIVFAKAPASDTAKQLPSAEAIAAKAKASDLDVAKLTAWCAILSAEGKDDRKVDDFWPMWLANPDIVKGLRSAVKRDREAQATFEEKSELFADFSGGELPEGWSTTGFGFQLGGETASLSFGANHELLAAPGVIDSGLLGPNHVGTLRSPSFPIPDARILVKARSNDVIMRVVPSNYHMAMYSALLFRGTIRKGNETATEGDWRWISFDGNLNKYIGQNGFLEFVDSKGGSVAIDEIRILKDGGPPNRRHPLIERVVESDDPAEGLDQVWSEVVSNLRKSAATAEDAEIVNWIAKHNLLRAADLNPALAAIHEDGLKTAGTIRVPQFAVAMTQGTPENAHVYIRGSHGNPGEEVPNRYLEAFGAKEGSRLDLADQIADAGNPLTSRVIVNRLWHHLFGRGIVPTVDDFGPQGQPASHPHLLDWLAADFTENGWSLKHTIREIVLSQSYRQDSVAHPDVDLDKVAIADPENIFLHRMPVRRLQAEAIRDAVLAVSGRLDPKQFGPAIPTHRTAFMTGRGARGSGPLDGDGRRSVYGAVYRNFLSPLMLTFDVPGPFGPKGRRSISNVPAQALAMMNDPFVVEQSKLWAKSVLAAPEQTPEQRIAAMIETATSREATAQQLLIFKAFLEQQAADYGKLDERAWADVAHAIFNTKDFVYLN